MVSTRGKVKAVADETPEKNETAKEVLAEKQTSDSLTVNVEEPEEDGQLKENLEIKVDEGKNEYNEEMAAKEESEKLMKVDNDDKNTLVAEMNGDGKEGSEQKTYESDGIDNQEDVIGHDEVETFEEDSEENVVDEDAEFLEEETKEEYDEEDGSSEDEATKEGDENDAKGDKEIAKEDGEKTAKHDAEKVEPCLKNIKESSERSRMKGVLAEMSKHVSLDGDEDEVREEVANEGDKNNTQDNKKIAKANGMETEDHSAEKLEISSKNTKKIRVRSRRKKVLPESSKKVGPGDKPESSSKRKVKNRVKSMGMIFMCSSKTKNDCYQYRVFGLPPSKKDIVEKIYTGMRLFLYDVDLRLMYGIYKASGPGGYNIEPKAFKSQFPSQVRFTVLDDCLPLAEEKFKSAIKDNYFTNTKFDCQLNSEQVKKLCKLFAASRKGHLSKKLGGGRKPENNQPVREERVRRQRPRDVKPPASREERPRKRRRKAISPVAAARQPIPAPRPSTVPSYVYVRASDANSDRHDPLLRRPDPLLRRPDPYRDGQDRNMERHYSYSGGRDPYIERRDPYPERVDPHIGERVSYLERRDIEEQDPYREGRDSYLGRRGSEGRDSYIMRRDRGEHHLYRDGRDSHLLSCDRDVRDPYILSRDPYRERRDSYLAPPTYRDRTNSELYSSYRRDLALERPVYVEDRRVEYPDSYRREEVLERRDPHPITTETRRHDDIASRDPYVPYGVRPSYAEATYPAEYPSGVGLTRVYRL